MSTKSQQNTPQTEVNVKTSWAFLFNYIWLILELYVILLISETYLDNHLITSMILLAFAGIYYWLNFSNHTASQVVFILGLAVIHSFNWSNQNTLIISYILLTSLLIYGIVRVAFTSITIANNSICTTFLTIEHHETPNWKGSTKTTQILPGKILNFGSIHIANAETTTKSNSFLSKRNGTDEVIRIDGIANPDSILKEIQHKFTT